MKKFLSNLEFLLYGALCLIVLYGVFVYFQFTQTKEKMINDSFAIAIEEVNEFSVNIEKYYKNNFNPLEKDASEYKKYSAYLNSFETKKYRNIFISRVKNGHFFVIADGEGDLSERFVFNEKFDPLTPKWDEVLKHKKPLYYTPDIEGLWITYLYPIIKDDDVVMLLAIDFSMKHYLDTEMELDILKESLIYFIILILISILILIFFLYFEKERKNQWILINKQREGYLLEQSKHAQIGKIIDSVAHQWIQPLQSIHAISELFLLKLHRKKEVKVTDQVEHINDIMFQTNFALETLAEFRTFLSQNKEKKLCNIESVLKSAILILDDIILHHQIDITISGNTSLKLWMYENEFKHVIINLIQNAKDAFIAHDISHRKIHFKLIKDEDSIVLEVSDNAGGIKDDLIDHIFELNISTKDTSSKGMGLYMSKSIIKKIDGEVFAYNNKIGGVTFVMQWKVK